MADLDPGGFDLNQPLPVVGDDHEVTRPAVVLVDPDPGGFDSNQPQPVVEDDHEVRRPAVQVYISNPFDWDEVQDDLFDVNNPIFFENNGEGWSTTCSFCLFLHYCMVPLICSRHADEEGEIEYNEEENLPDLISMPPTQELPPQNVMPQAPVALDLNAMPGNDSILAKPEIAYLSVVDYCSFCSRSFC